MSKEMKPEKRVILTVLNIIHKDQNIHKSYTHLDLIEYKEVWRNMYKDIHSLVTELPLLTGQKVGMPFLTIFRKPLGFK